jgi:radical SAM superfamily enzyme YgiQ (UPF0313 family)
MRLVLTTPPFNLFKDGYGSKTRIREGHLPPLGIGCIAAVTLKAGIETLVVDSLAMGLDLEGACDAIHSLKPDVIGISVITATASHAVRLAGMLKEKVNTPVIMGGPHATCFPEEVVRSPGIDYAVAGEGEKVILPLLKCISDKAKPAACAGWCSKTAIRL